MQVLYVLHWQKTVA